MSSSSSPSARVFHRLSTAEQDLALRLVQASGSLKELARQYGVSYPTIRARLDRLIERIAAVQGETQPDPMANTLADLIEQGQISPAAARTALALHRQVLEQVRPDQD